MALQIPEEVEVDALANMHSHVREGDVVGPLIRNGILGGADIILMMTNTKDGVLTAQQSSNYLVWAQHQTEMFIDSLTPSVKHVRLVPIVILTEDTLLIEFDRSVELGIMDWKVLPFKRTTNSHYGVRNYARLIEKVRYAGERGIRVHWHPEHPDMDIESADAEYLFHPIMDMMMHETDAVMFWEHGTDSRCIPFWKKWAATGRFFVTLTAHHLATHQDEAFGDVRSVCKPPIKMRRDREALIGLIMENHPWVMAGGDDAPHDRSKKHISVSTETCACGAYTAPFLHALYAHAFLDRLLQVPGGLDTYINFTSRNARKAFGFFGPAGKRRLVRKPFVILRSYQAASWTVEPFWAGRTLDWSLAG